MPWPSLLFVLQLKKEVLSEIKDKGAAEAPSPELQQKAGIPASTTLGSLLAALEHLIKAYEAGLRDFKATPLTPEEKQLQAEIQKMESSLKAEGFLDSLKGKGLFSDKSPR